SGTARKDVEAVFGTGKVVEKNPGPRPTGYVYPVSNYEVLVDGESVRFRIAIHYDGEQAAQVYVSHLCVLQQRFEIPAEDPPTDELRGVLLDLIDAMR